MIGSNPPRFWWTPGTTYLLIGGTLRLVWPTAFEAILGLIAIVFVWYSWKVSPYAAIKAVGWVVFPIRNTKTIAVDSKGRRLSERDPNDQSTILVIEPELTDEEMHRFSTKKRSWEESRSLEELNEEPF